ncbi:uncharacterized protein LOC111707826 [Eurytemora carolleeae]|uniref:uncharacterized protein LOC111707826 n=1 Tax=Eurytemora carolleeae TaxID=1294199 RepID=UPI000C78827C|nr:uncharacterized protein LOC111707826 [Eurytemora carolleeae]|eukprot:XP_023336755.1 uncharacterized protein LOC111707826 [Eurytemora affinis]
MEFYSEQEKKSDENKVNFNSDLLTLSVSTHKIDENRLFEEFISLVDNPLNASNPETEEDTIGDPSYSHTPSHPRRSSLPSHPRASPLPHTVTSEEALPAERPSSDQERLKTTQKKIFYSSLGSGGAPGLSSSGQRRSSLSPTGGWRSSSPSSRILATSPKLLATSPKGFGSSTSSGGLSVSPLSLHSLSPPERLAGSWVQQGRPLPAMENIGQPIPGLETFQSVSSLPQVHGVPASSTRTFSSTYTGHTVHKLYTNPCTSAQYTLQPVLKQKPKPETGVWETGVQQRNTERSLLRKHLQSKEGPSAAQCEKCGRTLTAKCIMETCNRPEEVICQICGVELTVKCILGSCGAN